MIAGLGLGTFAMLYGLYALGTNSRALSVVHSQGDYLWLRDVHSGLLQPVPVWPPSGASGITAR